MPREIPSSTFDAGLPPADPDHDLCASCGHSWWEHSGIRCCYKRGSIWRDAKPQGASALALDRLRALYNLGGRPELPEDVTKAGEGSPPRMLQIATACAEMEVTINRQKAEIEALQRRIDSYDNEIRRLDKRFRAERAERDRLERKLDTLAPAVPVQTPPSRHHWAALDWGSIERSYAEMLQAPYAPPRFFIDEPARSPEDPTLPPF